MHNILRILLTLIVALLCTSCFEVHQTVWIQSNGSGKARIYADIPIAVATMQGGANHIEKMITDFTTGNEIISLEKITTKKIDDRLELTVSFSFDDARDLKKLTELDAFSKFPTQSSQLFGETSIALKGLQLEYKQKRDLSKLVPGSRWLPKQLFADRFLKTTLHLPVAVSTHNADKISADGRTLTWSTPLAIALTEPSTQTFSMPLPIPWLEIITTIALTISLLVVLYFFWKKKRKRDDKK